MNFKTISLTGLSKTIFTLIKPQLDANIKRFKNGSKAKVKQSRSKTGTNNNVNNKDNLNVNNNQNNKENKKEKDNENTVPPSSFSFSDFWDLYNKKTGLTKCEALWEELTEHDKLLIKERLPAYIKATRDEVTYRKDPATWLDGKHWLDEHVPRGVKKSAFEILIETGRYE